MTLADGLALDCQDEELSEAQLAFYGKARKDYERTIAEATQLKREGTSVTKSGNIWLVKSTYQVKLANVPRQASTVNAKIPNDPVTAFKLGTNPTELVKAAVNAANLLGQTASSSGPVAPAVLLPTQQQQQKPQQQQLQQGTKPVSSPVVVESLPDPRSLPSPISKPPSQLPAGIRPGMLAPSVQPSISKTGSITVAKLPMAPSAPPTVPPTPPAVKSAPPPIAIAPKKTGAAAAAEDTKLLAKTIPALCITVKPARLVPEAVNLKKREVLDSFVKSRLVMDHRRFAEWLMQVGLLRTQQSSTCRAHSPHSPAPLQLRMYAEESRFPHSGGYVWISTCCERNFVSIFRESIFEDSANPPTVFLKLIYHWACQTLVNNVMQWVKVDHLLIRDFYSMLRSVCTVEIHSSTPVFGVSANNQHVEIGVISLGTTTTDGKRRDVKVEVLGVYDQETQRLRLQASDPIVGDSRTRSRFTKILQPLPNWVSPNAVILTDFTVDKVALEDLGFHHVVQKTLSTASPDDKLTNRNVMEYLRKTVPKVFQNTLSALNTATIQQFLDELLWREMNGSSYYDAFHNIIRDLSTQTRAEMGMPLVKRLPAVAADPFKDWNVNVASRSADSAPLSATPATVPNNANVGAKRPASVPVGEGGPNSKEPRLTAQVNYYATAQGYVVNEIKDLDVVCQIGNCKRTVKSGLHLIVHVRKHLHREGASAADSIRVTEPCSYCLQWFPNIIARQKHEESAHRFVSSFKVSQPNREDSAVLNDIVCLICHEKFTQLRSLDLHMEKNHVACEMPYRCRACNYQSSSHAMVVDHFHQAHRNSSVILCPICFETFTCLEAGKPNFSGGEPGHLLYLAHLKKHLSQIQHHSCKRCVLSFLQYEALRYHVRTDHTSSATNANVRPFTFKITNPSSFAKQAAIAAPPVSVTPSLADKVPVKSYSKAGPSPGPVHVSTAGPSSTLNLPNTTVTRRFPNLTVDLTRDQLGACLCFECQEPMEKRGHFTGYLCCSSCRFSTCCIAAMKQHQQLVHTASAALTFGPVFSLSASVTCDCQEFVSRSGPEVEHHVLTCRFKTLTVADI